VRADENSLSCGVHSVVFAGMEKQKDKVSGAVNSAGAEKGTDLFLHAASANVSSLFSPAMRLFYGEGS